MQERQHVDPDWKNEPFYYSRFPDQKVVYTQQGNETTDLLYVFNDTSMWKLSEEDLVKWQNAESDTGENELERIQRTHPILDYGAPNLLYASWEDTASMNPDHIGREADVSNEWQNMQEVCAVASMRGGQGNCLPNILCSV